MHLSVSYFEISQLKKLHEHKNHLQSDLSLLLYKTLIKLVFCIAISYFCAVNQLINNYESKIKAYR